MAIIELKYHIINLIIKMLHVLCNLVWKNAKSDRMKKKLDIFQDLFSSSCLKKIDAGLHNS